MEYHVLNGDSLKMQFPKDLKSNLIVARECLVDGDVKGETLTELFKTREKFISTTYPGYTPNEYQKKTVSEFEKFKNLKDGDTLNLWFEEDLFCQVNFWFVSNLLSNLNQPFKTYLVLPSGSNLQYGFGGLSEKELVSSYNQRITVPKDLVQKIGKLWPAYQNDDFKRLSEIGKELENIFTFILTAVNAHLERFPEDGKYGRPEQSIIDIIKEKNTKEFGTVFKEFNKKEAIYGFGDLQVKRIFDKVLEEID